MQFNNVNADTRFWQFSVARLISA